MSTEMFTAKQVYELISVGMIRSAVKLNDERNKNEAQALVIQQLQNDLAATEGCSRAHLIRLETENAAAKDCIRRMEQDMVHVDMECRGRCRDLETMVERCTVLEREKATITAERDAWAKKWRDAAELAGVYVHLTPRQKETTK